MILVNTRTSGLTPSASINEVDPRGGAAVTGENSVGKTTTLNLLPLFFGTAPSDVSVTAGGREPVLRYVLQTPQSAIVFEYQVGEDPKHDLRCVVLRRHDPEDRGEYRLFSGSFQADYFTVEIEPGRRVFCDDRQMLGALDAAGIRYEEKLSLSSYRAVILGLQAQTAEAKKLRVLSTTYGFGGAGARLTNLDKLISAVVKERVDFKDFLQLAVTIVQERLSNKVSGAEKYKITLPQSRAQIENWLEDRAALEGAMKLTDRVGGLRRLLAEYVQAQRSLEDARLLIPGLAMHRKHTAKTLRIELEALESDRERALGKAKELESGLRNSVARARGAKDEAAQKVLAEEARQKSLCLLEVPVWSAELESLPGLRTQKKNLETQKELLSEQASSIQAPINELIATVHARGASQAAELRSKQLPVSRACAAELLVIGNAEVSQLDALRPVHEQQLEELNNQIEDFNDQIATARVLSTSAQASDELSQALVSAQTAQQEHAKEVSAAQQEAFDAATSEALAKAAFLEAEARHNAAIVHREKTQADAEAAQAMLTPADGSLLSALRAETGGRWRDDLARVLDPNLLSRADLSPGFSMPGDETLFGWSLDVGQIESPGWTNDAVLREELAQALRVYSSAKQLVVDAHRDQTSASKERMKAEKAREVLTARLTTLQGKSSAKEEAITLARLRCDSDQAAARAKALSDVKDLIARRKDVADQRVGMQARQEAERDAVRSATTKAKGQASERADRAIDALETQAKQAEASSAQQVQDLQKQLLEQLDDAGVNTGRFTALQTQIDNLVTSIRTIEERTSTVERWKAWLDEGGHNILTGLSDDLAILEHQQQLCEGGLSTFLDQQRRDLDAYTSRHREVSMKLGEAGSDLDTLNRLMQRHKVDDEPTRSVDPQLSVASLSQELHQFSAALDEAEGELRGENGKLRDLLTGRRSKVAELVEQSLGALGSESTLASRAECLCNAHADLNKNVLPIVSNGAQTILEKIHQFRSSITTFAGEVERFNAELKRGLQSAAKFKRISDFNAAVVTDFKDIGFFKGLDVVDEVARDAAASRAAGVGHVLPDERTAAALRHLASLLSRDSTLEVNLTQHVALRGSVNINGEVKHFSRDQDLEHISSTGINAIVLITLLSGMLNMIRGNADVYIPWVSDEVGKFDGGNFKALMDNLRDNRIDPVTASPKLTIAEYRHFARCYLFQDRGRIARYAGIREQTNADRAEVEA